MKTTRCHLTSTKTATVGKAEVKEWWDMGGGNVRWHSHCENQHGSGDSPKTLKIELPHDPVIPLLGIYRKELKVGSWGAICTPTFTAAFFTTAKRWRQPWGPPTDEWVKNVWSIHTVECYLKWKEILSPATTRMQVKEIILGDISQSQTDKYRMTPLTSGPWRDRTRRERQ